ncbi:MAG: sulfatase [Syntrophothermus sp.]
MQNPRGLSRREFLKLISLAPVGIYFRPLARLAQGAAGSDQKNILVIVFDAWSQHHVSLYGYPRRTMPNLEKFAEKATVYHNHYSTATFTVPGASSLLTGMHPWTHRALQLGGGLADSQAGHTIFSALSSTHSTLAYTQNKFADQILNQSDGSLDRHVPHWSFNMEYNSLYGASFFRKDARTAFASIEDNIIQKGEGTDTSLFFGPLYRLHMLGERQKDQQKYAQAYPEGLPDAASEAFLLPDVVDGAINLLKGIEQPTLAYLHFYSPHEPYTPTEQFFNHFANDGWRAPEKPIHELSEKRWAPGVLHQQRQYYDEYIASWDHEVARLFQFLEDSGLTGNSHIFVTSDHGEFFERGEMGHWTKMIYDPVIHVPLIVRSPGQASRQDVQAFTSSVDLVPTIAKLTGNPIPGWVEGQLLPGLGGEADDGRSIFSMDAKTNSSFGPFKNYSVSITRDHHRLVHYSYPRDNYEKYEFYDLDADREELKDLYPSHPSLADQMKEELADKVRKVNLPYQRNGL